MNEELLVLLLHTPVILATLSVETPPGPVEIMECGVGQSQFAKVCCI